MSFLSPGYLPEPGIEPASPAWQADSLLLGHLGSQAVKILFFLKLRDYNLQVEILYLIEMGSFEPHAQIAKAVYNMP